MNIHDVHKRLSAFGHALPPLPFQAGHLRITREDDFLVADNGDTREHLNDAQLHGLCALIAGQPVTPGSAISLPLRLLTDAILEAGGEVYFLPGRPGEHGEDSEPDGVAVTVANVTHLGQQFHQTGPRAGYAALYFDHAVAEHIFSSRDNPDDAAREICWYTHPLSSHVTFTTVPIPLSSHPTVDPVLLEEHQLTEAVNQPGAPGTFTVSAELLRRLLRERTRPPF